MKHKIQTCQIVIIIVVVVVVIIVVVVVVVVVVIIIVNDWQFLSTFVDTGQQHCPCDSSLLLSCSWPRRKYYVVAHSLSE